MGLSVASEPLLCELLPNYSFLLPFSDCYHKNGRNDHLTDLHNAFTILKDSKNASPAKRLIYCQILIF